MLARLATPAIRHDLHRTCHATVPARVPLAARGGVRGKLTKPCMVASDSTKQTEGAGADGLLRTFDEDVEKLLLQHGIPAGQLVQHVRDTAIRASAALPPLQVQYCASRYGVFRYSEAYEAWSSINGGHVKEAEADEAAEEADYDRSRDPDARGTMRRFARDILGLCPGFAQLMLVYHKLGVTDLLEDVAEATKAGGACLSHDPALVRAAQRFQQEQAARAAFAAPRRCPETGRYAFVDHLLATGEYDWGVQSSFCKEDMEFVSFLLNDDDDNEHPAWGKDYSLEGVRFAYGPRWWARKDQDALEYIGCMLAGGYDCQIAIADVPALSDWRVQAFDGREKVYWC